MGGHDAETAYPPFCGLELEELGGREGTVSVGELISNSSVEGM